ncbi:MAG: DUF4417 domain-containing protein [Bacilli bacterium]|nr:DUF4417 domain-containing protein [Bacilli bacterium]
MANKNYFFDDGYQEHLVEGAFFEGEEGIPCLLNLDNCEIPTNLIPFSKARSCPKKTGYVHFYEHDIRWRQVMTSTDKYLDLLKQFDGVISPDPTIIIGKSRCLHATSTYMNRAVAYCLQRKGIPVIPNIRWGDETTFGFAFAGVPKHSIVAISTHGAIRRDRNTNNYLRNCFKNGLREMIRRLEPKTVIVHGFMPNDIFVEFKDATIFVRFPSEYEKTHGKGAD